MFSIFFLNAMCLWCISNLQDQSSLYYLATSMAKIGKVIILTLFIFITPLIGRVKVQYLHTFKFLKL